MIDGPLLLRAKDVAARLGVSESSVYRLMDRQGLPFVLVGRDRRVPAAALSAWVDRQTRVASEPHPGEPHEPVPQAYIVGARAYVAKVCALCGQMLDDGRRR